MHTFCFCNSTTSENDIKIHCSDCDLAIFALWLELSIIIFNHLAKMLFNHICLAQNHNEKEKKKIVICGEEKIKMSSIPINSQSIAQFTIYHICAYFCSFFGDLCRNSPLRPFRKKKLFFEVFIISFISRCSFVWAWSALCKIKFIHDPMQKWIFIICIRIRICIHHLDLRIANALNKCVPSLQYDLFVPCVRFRYSFAQLCTVQQ